MAISQDTIREIHNAVDILEVVEDYVQLKKKGHNWWGCCPFHQEKTPSFSVAPNKGIFHCFGCKETGDAISFIRKIEGKSYTEALRHLALKYGIQITETVATAEQEEREKQRESLYIAMGFANEYYRRLLKEDAEGRSVGLGYFKERGFLDATIEKFELGYSRNEWDGLLKAATQAGYQQQVLEETGLILRKEGQEDRVYDRFRGRVMFPVHNLSGRVIAFGARTLRKDDKPKYLNSPETDIYHKGEVLYGIYQAKQSIRQQDNCYLVEGYTDVLTLHQAGIHNVVSSSGTALTDGQIKLIKRFTKQVTLLYDGDFAGIKAALRGTDLLLERGVDVRVVMFPDGHDPDSYCRQVGGQAFAEYLQANAQDFILYTTELFLKDAEHDPIKRANVIRDIVESISKIPDPIKQSVFYQECARILGMDEALLRTEGERIRQQQRQREEKRRSHQGGTPSAPSEAPAWEIPPPPIAQGFHPQETDAYWADVPPEHLDDSFGQGTAPPRSSRPADSSGHERNYIRVLLIYGHQVLPGCDFYLHEYLLGELDNMPRFAHPVLQQFIFEYKNKVALGELPEPSHWIEYEGHELRKLASELFKEETKLSDNWVKKGVPVPLYLGGIWKEAQDIINNLKLIHVEKLQQECSLRIEQNPEQLDELLLKNIELDKLRMELAAKLGRVL